MPNFKCQNPFTFTLLFLQIFSFFENRNCQCRSTLASNLNPKGDSRRAPLLLTPTLNFQFGDENSKIYINFLFAPARNKNVRIAHNNMQLGVNLCASKKVSINFAMLGKKIEISK